MWKRSDKNFNKNLSHKTIFSSTDKITDIIKMFFVNLKTVCEGGVNSVSSMRTQ